MSVILGAAAIAGGASLLGGFLSAKGDEDAAKDSFEYTKELQKRSFDFTERMRSTAYQTSVKDLRAAGLNPILAAGRPGPATAQSFGSPSAPHASGKGRAAVAAAAGVSSAAIKAIKATSEKSILQSQVEKAKHEVMLVNAQSVLTEEQALLTRETNRKMRHETALKGIEEKILGAQIPSAQVQEKFDKSTAGQRLRVLQRIKNAINPFSPGSPGK